MSLSCPCYQHHHQDKIIDVRAAVEEYSANYKITRSPCRKERFLGFSNVNSEKTTELLTDVPTRWNSTFHMFNRALVSK